MGTLKITNQLSPLAMTVRICFYENMFPNKDNKSSIKGGKKKTSSLKALANNQINQTLWGQEPRKSDAQYFLMFFILEEFTDL